MIPKVLRRAQGLIYTEVPGKSHNVEHARLMYGRRFEQCIHFYGIDE